VVSTDRDLGLDLDRPTVDHGESDRDLGLGGELGEVGSSVIGLDLGELSDRLSGESREEHGLGGLTLPLGGERPASSVLRLRTPQQTERPGKRNQL
jgi:hypothetical protein